MNKPNRALLLKYGVATILVAALILLSIFLPAKLSQVSDRSLLDVIKTEEGNNSPESFRYSLTTPERLYILSMALGNRDILQSDYAASLREKAIRTNRKDTVVSYAYVENVRGLAPEEMNGVSAQEVCNSGLGVIVKEGLGIDDFRITNSCRQTLYSAVDILEPQKNVSVWHLEYSAAVPPAGEPFALMEAYVDAETGKIYGFAFRGEPLVDFDADQLARAWLKQLEITDLGDITENNPLTETATQYKKFATEGMNLEKTVFTVGFYEGINEVFIKITS